MEQPAPEPESHTNQAARERTQPTESRQQHSKHGFRDK